MNPFIHMRKRRETMNEYKRIFVIVIDSLGVGAHPDAKLFDDDGCDTLGHIDAAMSLYVPHLQSLGLANLHPLLNVESVSQPLGYYTKMIELSAGKDTLTGHWEMMGIQTSQPFQTFTDTGFPKELISALEKETGRKIIGNKAASGTKILDELAEQANCSKEMIVYTSADSVLQICGHENPEIMGLEALYKYCEIARQLTLKDEWKVGRVIARPYVGTKKGSFKRTANRHDYALKPPKDTVLNELKANGFDVISIGKINDIFDGEGISEAHHSNSSVHGMKQTLEMIDQQFHGLCFVNLVDFDALWGHRRDPIGYGKELEQFDVQLGCLLQQLKDDDLLMITADHGNDPSFKGTDHTRELVPLILYSPSHLGHGLLPYATSFANIGATIAENFHIPMPSIGSSYKNMLK